MRAVLHADLAAGGRDADKVASVGATEDAPCSPRSHVSVPHWPLCSESLVAASPLRRELRPPADAELRVNVTEVVKPPSWDSGRAHRRPVGCCTPPRRDASQHSPEVSDWAVDRRVDRRSSRTRGRTRAVRPRRVEGRDARQDRAATARPPAGLPPRLDVHPGGGGTLPDWCRAWLARSDPTRRRRAVLPR